MAARSRRVHLGLILALVVAFAATLVTGGTASADTDLIVGNTARIAYANGDNVRLRENPGYDAPILAKYPEGTSVTVLADYTDDADGNHWYNVSIDSDGLVGYIVSDYLALPNGDPVDPDAVDDQVAVIAEEPAAVGSVIATGYVAGTNNDGVRCRTAASTSSSIIVVLPEGSEVGVTGDAIEGVWMPVVCRGVAGFISTAYFSWNAPSVAAPATTTDDGDTAFVNEVTGTATVAGTGNGLRCRAEASTSGSIIKVFADGQSVDLRGDKSGDWQPVYCGNTPGFVFASYLNYGGESAGTADTSSGGNTVTGTSTVAGTNGDGVRCRTSASTSGSVITVLREGTSVQLRGDRSGDWQPVFCAGSNGFVWAAYLGGSSSSDSGSASSGSTNAGSSEVTGTAIVYGSGGGLRCRSGASTSASILMVMPEGSTIQLRGALQGDWQPVLCGGQSGFANSMYIRYSDSTQMPTSNGDTTTPNTRFAEGAQAEVSGTTGGGVRLRSSASFSASVLMVIAEGNIVTVRAGSTGEWIAVTYSGSNGFVHQDYLVASEGNTGSSSNSGSTSSNTTTSGLASGDHATVTSDLRLRYDATYSAGVAAVAPAGVVVLITGAAVNGFYPVDWDGLKGYMSGSYLSYTTDDLSIRGGSGDNGSDTSGGSTGTSGGGNGSITSFALQYVGYPYVWATHGPSSFDCSGFTYWVIWNVLGVNIGYSVTSQLSAGTPVSLANLQPGDLIIFQNTYTWGPSHVGIYLGNGQFVHAENSSTGVVISSLSSSYYSTRFYTGIRVG